LLGKARYKYINVNIFHSIKFKLMMRRNGRERGLFAYREDPEKVSFKG
jgi:hypothetical protein